MKISYLNSKNERIEETISNFTVDCNNQLMAFEESVERLLQIDSITCKIVVDRIDYDRIIVKKTY